MTQLELKRKVLHHVIPADDMAISTSQASLAFVAILVVFALVYRVRIIEALYHWRHSARYNMAFQEDLEAGLSSASFDISPNLTSDTRAGLDEAAKTRIRLLMELQNLTFDEARLQDTRATMGQNGIDESGMPTDPKTVTFS